RLLRGERLFRQSRPARQTTARCADHRAERRIRPGGSGAQAVGATGFVAAFGPPRCGSSGRTRPAGVGVPSSARRDDDSEAALTASRPKIAAAAAVLVRNCAYLRTLR